MGSHLGAVREKGFIPYDYDVDVMASFDHRKLFWEAISETLREVPNSIIDVDNWTPRKDAAMISIYGLRIEFWFFHIRGDTVAIDSTAVPNKKVEDVFPVKLREFEGMLLPFPRNSEKILRDEYGENWRKKRPCLRKRMLL